MIHLNAEQIARNEHENYNPETNDFLWNEDYTEVTIIPFSRNASQDYEPHQCGFCGDQIANGEFCPVCIALGEALWRFPSVKEAEERYNPNRNYDNDLPF